MHKIGLKMSFSQKSSKIWHTSPVRDFQNSQMSFPQKSSEIWYTSHVRDFQLAKCRKLVWKIYIGVFGVKPWDSPKKSKSPWMDPLPKVKKLWGLWFLWWILQHYTKNTYVYFKVFFLLPLTKVSTTSKGVSSASE